jgi:FkbM family methyltransferase
MRRNSHQRRAAVTIGAEIPETFAREYDLGVLHLATPSGRDFPTLRSVEVETTTVDALLAAKLPCPLVIKINTEGHEHAVMKGMSETLVL